jgi:hypothetical protein
MGIYPCSPPPKRLTPARLIVRDWWFGFFTGAMTLFVLELFCWIAVTSSGPKLTLGHVVLR